MYRVELTAVPGERVVCYARSQTDVDGAAGRGQNEETAPSVSVQWIVVDSGTVGVACTRLLAVCHAVRRLVPSSAVHVAVVIRRPRVVAS